MKKSRKLAWVVLGVVVSVNACLLTWMSTIYSPGKANLYHPGNGSSGPIYVGVRYQTFPWLPGKNFVTEQITPEEYEEWTRHSKP